MKRLLHSKWILDAYGVVFSQVLAPRWSHWHDLMQMQVMCWWLSWKESDLFHLCQRPRVFCCCFLNTLHSPFLKSSFYLGFSLVKFLSWAATLTNCWVSLSAVIFHPNFPSEKREHIFHQWSPPEQTLIMFVYYFYRIFIILWAHIYILLFSLNIILSAFFPLVIFFVIIIFGCRIKVCNFSLRWWEQIMFDVFGNKSQSSPSACQIDHFYPHPRYFFLTHAVVWWFSQVPREAWVELGALYLCFEVLLLRWSNPAAELYRKGLVNSVAFTDSHTVVESQMP